ncbi:Plant UBX domain-containing protein 12 [Raphanus sativus]|uniref:Plant UBX domain-containing protein 12-like n=1 Tax=Raphanus sativus TaxID=3726 RepID=A0A6J0P0N7_RAPSA|nr:plant UBX domain-containing protein 12-like [Raphanus sativus]KAJ4897649.1 Plant UBX domain-containing protein 12 [Raphanus sativus]
MAKRSLAMFECQSLVENLSPFVDTKRQKRSSDIAVATESTTTTTTTCLFPKADIGYPELSEEPNSDWDRSVLCRICVRLPDGRRVQRNFLNSESVQLLWSFCYSQIDQSERNMPFKLFQAVPGYYKTLYYGSYTSFEQSGLANSLISVTWM